MSEVILGPATPWLTLLFPMEYLGTYFVPQQQQLVFVWCCPAAVQQREPVPPVHLTVQDMPAHTLLQAMEAWGRNLAAAHKCESTLCGSLLQQGSSDRWLCTSVIAST